MSKYLLLWCCNVLLQTFCKWLVGKKLIIRSTSIFFVQQLTVMHMCKRKKIVCFSFGLNVFIHPLTKFFLFYEIKCTRLKKATITRSFYYILLLVDKELSSILLSRLSIIIFPTKGEDEIKNFGGKVKY